MTFDNPFDKGFVVILFFQAFWTLARSWERLDLTSRLHPSILIRLPPKTLHSLDQFSSINSITMAIHFLNVEGLKNLQIKLMSVLMSLELNFLDLFEKNPLK